MYFESYNTGTINNIIVSQFEYKAMSIHRGLSENAISDKILDSHFKVLKHVTISCANRFS